MKFLLLNSTHSLVRFVSTLPFIDSRILKIRSSNMYPLYNRLHYCLMFLDLLINPLLVFPKVFVEKVKKRFNCWPKDLSLYNVCISLKKSRPIPQYIYTVGSKCKFENLWAHKIINLEYLVLSKKHH